MRGDINFRSWNEWKQFVVYANLLELTMVFAKIGGDEIYDTPYPIPSELSYPGFNTLTK